MFPIQTFQSSRVQLTKGAARMAAAASVVIAVLALTGCANTPMAQAAVAEGQTAPATGCDTNAGYGMAGVTHAATKREFDECRRLLAQRPSRVIVSQSQNQP